MNENEKLSAYRRLEKAANLMDASITIPGTQFRIGLDAIIGLFPGGGDVISAIIATLISLEGFRITKKPTLLIRSLFNVLIDVLVGLVPILGDLVDAGYKANLRNVDLVREELRILPEESELEVDHPAAWQRWLVVALVLAALVLIAMILDDVNSAAELSQPWRVDELIDRLMNRQPD